MNYKFHLSHSYHDELGSYIVVTIQLRKHNILIIWTNENDLYQFGDTPSYIVKLENQLSKKGIITDLKFGRQIIVNEENDVLTNN
jgi:hypothetical protein